VNKAYSPASTVFPSMITALENEILVELLAPVRHN